MFTTESVVISDKFLASKQVPLMTSVKPKSFDNESIAFDTVNGIRQRKVITKT